MTYLEVVTAQSTALGNKRTAVELLTRRMTASVLLVKALGGGWDPSTLPRSSIVSSLNPADVQLSRRPSGRKAVGELVSQPFSPRNS